MKGQGGQLCRLPVDLPSVLLGGGTSLLAVPASGYRTKSRGGSHGLLRAPGSNVDSCADAVAPVDGRPPRGLGAPSAAGDGVTSPLGLPIGVASYHSLLTCHRRR